MRAGIIFILFLITSQGMAQYSGYVFIDQNDNRIMDPNESGLGGVAVSNGEHVIRTDRFGKFTPSQVNQG